ncbi:MULTISPECIES: 3-dehydroquinate synthase [unclassified Nitratiruptor]|uniref:3-dehydroquinate synthase n=1 Tax=unclassified Nitratiruptor TaxID=2624044 RepID=UPI001915ED54|nr:MULTISPECIES: 3-dehydroquinate synthase [unclassified Nitratiruptor]BCD60197.1 3-dehydroquinate synthase [Nitratiruptor sp. YY08-10]BCD64314.1 3-dehydroquinate synthase [Nitratiruptor sp. YY08-14]
MEVFIDLKKHEDRNYPIHIGPIETIQLTSKAAIVTNPKVAGLHLKYLLNKIEAPELYIITLPDGEDYKNQETIDFLLDRLFDHKLDRKSMLIAFGGGVIGDMTGFAASIFQRGIDFIQIPTTLLSQVDASVGGKTGINNRFGKNLIGAFHQPKAVYIDTHFLKTLPQREFSAGVAEIVKMAVVFDKDFFEWLMKNDLQEEDNLKYAIKRSVELKAAIVAKDEREGGIRASLNYGHTFAHVIENETGYKRFLHGEAVAIGMVMANELAVKTGLLSREDAEKIKNLLQRYNLPVCYEVKDPEDFYEHFFLDKKTQNDTIKFVLPKGIGDFVITDTIKKDQIIDVLREFEKC